MDRWVDSEVVYTAKSKKFGIIGYFVIDRLINGGSYGGIRIVSDISLSELQSVARSMTYKNAFIGNRIGGAKAAVIVNKDNEKFRKDILIEFGKCISPFIKNRTYIPVLDMGISIEELQIIFDAAGYRYDTLSWKNLSHEYTAYTCFFATICALEKKGISIKDATFSIQGFGNVGSTYATLMNKAGARLIAFSNKYTGLIDRKGFDIRRLVQERSVKGDDFILKNTMGEETSHNSVLEEDVTILLPASNALTINDENWKRIKADIIICAANAPMSYDIERLLYKNGKMIITDFVANCGGILGSRIDNYVTKDIILHIISTIYKRKIDSLLCQSAASNRPLVDTVIKEVEKRIDTDNMYVNLNGKLTDKLIYLSSNSISPIKRIVQTYMSKKCISVYERLWS